MSDKLPDFLQGVIARYPEVWRDYEILSETIRRIDGLDDRSQRLVKLGIAIGAGREGSLKSHARRCLKEGFREEELFHAALLAVTTVGWSAAMSSLAVIEEVLQRAHKPPSSSV